MVAVAVEIKVAAVSARVLSRKLQLRREDARVEIPAQVLLAQRLHLAKGTCCRHDGHRTGEDRTVPQTVRPLQRILETGVLGKRLEIRIVGDRVGTAEAEIDRLLQGLERGLAVLAVRKRTGQVVAPGRIVRQQLHALTAHRRHLAVVALADGLDELGPQALVRRLAGGIVPDGQHRQQNASGQRHL